MGVLLISTFNNTRQQKISKKFRSEWFSEEIKSALKTEMMQRIQNHRCIGFRETKPQLLFDILKGITLEMLVLGCKTMPKLFGKQVLNHKN